LCFFDYWVLVLLEFCPLHHAVEATYGEFCKPVGPAGSCRIRSGWLCSTLSAVFTFEFRRSLRSPPLNNESVIRYTGRLGGALIK
jgi:hypothetical protein